MILPDRQRKVLYDHLTQFAVLNEVVQRHFVAASAGTYEDTSEQRYQKQLDGVRQVYMRLIEQREVTWLLSEEQERSILPMPIAAVSIK